MQTITTAFNIQPDGSIVREGDHAPGVSSGHDFGEISVRCERISEGRYVVSSPYRISAAEGWRATIFRDENDRRTIFLEINEGGDYVEYVCTSPQTGEPKDIVHLLTVRVAVEMPDHA